MSANLSVRTVALADERDLLDHVPETAPLGWLRHGEGIVAWGEAARVELAPEDAVRGAVRFDSAAHRLGRLFGSAEVDDAVELPGTGPVAFGSFTFDPRSSGSVLVVPRVVVGRRQGRTWLTTICDRPGSHPQELLARVTPWRPVEELRWSAGTLSSDEWQTAVARAVARIKDGELDKVVLARDALAQAREPIDVRRLLARLTRDYPDCYTFSVAGMVGATPELLVRREGEHVTALVLAGTRPRGRTESEDARLAEELFSSAKESEEHRYAIESLRATLSPLCSAIDTAEHPELLRLANVQHLASPVRATVGSGVATLEVVAALHPTAAVGGTPTTAAMELIAELEGMDRGRYAGPVGWIDARGNGEWGIAIRSAEIMGARARLFAGCGIVAGSEPATELAEAETKFRVMREALTDRG
ncbi:chorismate-binding protein [Salinactinospora qingdaonensis]|uniref:isochorismate synthase n=2 Tax=Salinactinospora qingdaonensis TaxID=702744 RepID=A0ABP7F2C3_9ACTN